MSIAMQAIGIVHSSRKEIQDDNWGDVISEICLDKRLFSEDATLGLKDFSHVEIIFYMNQVVPEKIHTGARHPRNDISLPKVGILAQRGKNRINQIGLSRAEIVEVDGLCVIVRGLDAIDQTPILDIKPYTKFFLPDASSIKEPQWLECIMK